MLTAILLSAFGPVTGIPDELGHIPAGRKLPCLPLAEIQICRLRYGRAYLSEGRSGKKAENRSSKDHWAVLASHTQTKPTLTPRSEYLPLPSRASGNTAAAQ